MNPETKSEELENLLAGVWECLAMEAEAQTADVTLSELHRAIEQSEFDMAKGWAN